MCAFFQIADRVADRDEPRQGPDLVRVVIPHGVLRGPRRPQPRRGT